MLRAGAAGRRTLRRTSVGLMQILRDGNTAAWFRQGVGITVAGAGVSVWADQSGNVRNLLQGTDTNRPALQADGSIIFDGVDNFLQSANFTLNQPLTYYLVWQQISWTEFDIIIDGATFASLAFDQHVASSRLGLYAGSNLNEAATTLSLNTWGISTLVANGASSSIQTNLLTATTGDIGAANAGGLNLGGSSGQFANMQVKELIVRSVADNPATRLAIQRRLAAIHGISI